MRRTRAISYPISVLVAATLGLAALPACTTQNTVVDAAVDAPVLVSEGCDTPITVEGYTNLNSDAFHFLEQGDKIAVITPSSLPTMEQFEATMAGLEAWG